MSKGQADHKVVPNARIPIDASAESTGVGAMSSEGSQTATPDG